MNLSDLARVVKDAKIVKHGDGLLVLKIDGDIDERQRAELVAMISAEIGPAEGRAPVIVCGRDSDVTSIEFDNALAIIRCHQADSATRDIIAAIWRDTWSASQRPAPPLLVLSDDERIDAEGQASIQAVTEALLAARSRPSVQDQAAALLDRFLIVHKPPSP